MPRPSKSDAGRILDYFRHADAGEVRVVFKLAGDIVKDRFAIPALLKHKKTRKVATAGQGQPTNLQETQQ